jgi:hypothetical protein
MGINSQILVASDGLSPLNNKPSGMITDPYRIKPALPSSGLGYKYLVGVNTFGIYGTDDFVSFTLLGDYVSAITHFKGLWIKPGPSSGSMQYSKNLVDWTEVVVDSGFNLATPIMNHIATRLVARSAYGRMYTSDDGINWTLRFTQATNDPPDGANLAYAGGYWLSYWRATGGTGFSYSSDGENWTTKAGSGSPMPTSVGSYGNVLNTWLFDGTHWHMTAYAYSAINVMYNRTTNLASWPTQTLIQATSSHAGTISRIDGLIIVAGLYVYSSSTHAHWYSTNGGANWTVVQGSAVNWQGRSAYTVNGVIHMFENTGKIYTSAGSDFTLKSQPLGWNQGPNWVHEVNRGLANGTL